MRDSVFDRGGPFQIRKVGHHRHEFLIPIPEDEHGRIARKCPIEDCSPGYFKVKPGTGITDTQEFAYCPYCGHASDPNEFATDEQFRFSREVVAREAHEGIEEMFRDALGVGRSGRKKIRVGTFSIETTYQPERPPNVRDPLEEELQRALVCPHCGLDHIVFGVAVWCPDCRRDIFLTHIEAEFAIVAAILLDVSRRREDLGERVAARDLENCLEDTVSIFEVAGKMILTRRLLESGNSKEETQAFLRKVVRNSFQSIDRTIELLKKEFHVELAELHSDNVLSRLRTIFEKRHAITHNLGVVDKKYLAKAMSAEKEGYEITVTYGEIEAAISDAKCVISSIHALLVKASD